MSGTSEPDLLNALEYRVHIVRLWGREYLDGFQFVYEHESTGAILDGPRCVTTRVDVQGATDMHEFTLYPNEYIVAVRGRQNRWTDALELKTVCNRVFRVGGNGGQPFKRDAAACSEVRFLTASANSHITNVQSRVSPARYVLPEQVTNSFYQLVLRHPAFRVSVIKMWRTWGKFEGIQMIFQRKVEPFDMYEGTFFGKSWCFQDELKDFLRKAEPFDMYEGALSWCFQDELKDFLRKAEPFDMFKGGQPWYFSEGPDVSVTLKLDEYVTMTLCRLDDSDGVTELRLRTSHGRNISCGNSNSSKFAFACHTLANCEVRGLRRSMERNSNGRYGKLEMHEIRRTATFDAAEFDAQFAAILEHAVSPEASLATGVPAPPSFVDDKCDDDDFEDEMFEIPETVYHRGIPSIEDLESRYLDLKNSLNGVYRDGDDCEIIVESVIKVHNKVLALHNRQIAYAGLLVIRLLELLKLTVSAIEKSSTFFSWSGREKRLERFSRVEQKARELFQDLERFTLIEAKFANHVLAEGKSASLEGVIWDAIRMKDLQTACALYCTSVKTAAMETARDTLLILAIREDNLGIFVEILRASPGGKSNDQFQINEDGRNLSLMDMDHVHNRFKCNSCGEWWIHGDRFRSIRGDDFDLCGECCPMSAPSQQGPFALCVEGGGMRFLANDSLLAVAVGAGAFHIVEWLVWHFGSDPFAQTMYGCNALDLCAQMTWLGDDGDKIHLLMTQYKRRRDFLSCTSTLMKHSQVSYDDVVKLVPCITSVYDLRTVFTFGNAHLQSAELKTLLAQAFDQILTEKLVLDDEASLFFDLVLDECKKRELLSQIDFMRWSRGNVRVNMENAAWVKEIKESIRNLTEQVEYVDRQLESVKRNVGELKRALVAKEEAETRRRNCKRIVSFLVMGLSLVGGPVFEQCFHAIIDYAVPEKLLMAIVDMDAESVLLKADVDSKDFVEVLREVVKLEQEDGDESTTSSDLAKDSIVQVGDARVHTASAADEGEEDRRAVNSTKRAPKSKKQPVSNNVSLFDLSQALIKARSSSSVVDSPPANDNKASTSTSPPPKGEPTKEMPPSSSKAVAPATSSPIQCKSLEETASPPPKKTTLAGMTSPMVGFPSLEEEKLDLDGYHYAVFHSGGKLDTFKELVGLIENQDSVNDEMEAEVIIRGKPQRVSLQPQVLASYMGFVEVVEYFFEHVLKLELKLKPTENKITTTTRAKKVSRQAKANGTANCAA